MTEPAAIRVETGRWWIAVFGVSILLGAFLLFQVQPVVSKAILPWFGGAPAVWTACMLFFQTLLFGGYLYAHLLQLRLSPRHQAAVHLALVVVALSLLPVVPGVEWKPSPEGDPTWRILLLLSATVGIPYFVLSATSPLVQTWFSGAYPGRSPYRLYALSNAGSLAALLSYPFIFEPMFDLSVQSLLWSGAFVLYAALCAALLACVWRVRSDTTAGLSGSACQTESLNYRVPLPACPAVQSAASCPTLLDKPAVAPPGEKSRLVVPASDARPGWFDRLRWPALPACASLMLLAATNHVCQDVAVVPFLWVVPLSLYLLSFIICFDHARWYVRPLWAGLAALSLAAAAVNDYARIGWSPLELSTELLLYFFALFCACMVCHGELARLKPAPRYLTEFYLLISAGGALGGVFVALVAPTIFSCYLEWPIGVAACFVLSVGLLIFPKRLPRRTSPLPLGDWPGARAARRSKKRRRSHPSNLTQPEKISAFRRAAERRGKQNSTQYKETRAQRNSPRLLPFAAKATKYAIFVIVVLFATIYVVDWELGLIKLVERARNFFGVVSVIYDGKTNEFQLRHGRITHGRQSADPEKRRWPTGYYSEQSGAGEAIRYYQQAGPVRVGLIGLGIGTLSAYARPGDVFRFYEINSEVLRLARQRFTYLDDCRGAWDVVLGDARLSLEAQPRQQFDVLVVDAFSGDAIPTHLLTREAFELYLRHLKPGGAIAVHVSNGYLRLAPVVRGLAEHCGMKTTRLCSPPDEGRLVDESEWIVATRNDGFLGAHPPRPPHLPDDDLKVPLWTDQYSNLFRILVKR